MDDVRGKQDGQRKEREHAVENRFVLEDVGEGVGEEGVAGDAGGCEGGNVKEEEVESKMDGVAQIENGGDLAPEQARQGREEEMNYLVKTLGMSRFMGRGDVESGQGSEKWIDRLRKDDDGREASTCCGRFETLTRGSEVEAVAQEVKASLLSTLHEADVRGP